MEFLDQDGSFTRTMPAPANVNSDWRLDDWQAVRVFLYFWKADKELLQNLPPGPGRARMKKRVARDRELILETWALLREQDPHSPTSVQDQ